MSLINKKDIIKGVEEFNKQRDKRDSIILPFFNRRLTQTQSEELCQVGSFLCLVDEPCSLLIQDDKPDFIIERNGEKIGLEHQRILNSKLKAHHNSISNLFNLASENFKEKHPEIKVFANFWLKKPDYSFKKHQVIHLVRIISDYIYDYISQNPSSAKPDFIQDVQLSKHSSVHFSFNPGGYLVSPLTSDILSTAIAKKESKVMSYIEKTQIAKQWLLLVTGTASPYSYEVDLNEINNLNVESQFDRIYLLDDLNRGLWRVL